MIHSFSDDDVTALLDRFLAEISSVVPLVALWAHGSLALGDFQPGRSDFDLVAIVRTDISDAQRDRLRAIHERLIRDTALAAKLHCTYVVSAELADPALRHLTWAQEELFDRPVTLVSRRELSVGGLSLSGPEPADLVPAVTDQALADFIRNDLKDFWYPATAERTRWLRDIWVDLGLLTLARATVTLAEGRLITKREALDVLINLGAPARVVDDIRERRYGSGHTNLGSWRIHRAHLARTFVHTGIERTLSL